MQHPVKPKAVISGGSRGIGNALAIRLAAAGFDVAIYSRSIEKLEVLKSTILEAYPQTDVYIKSCDAADKAAVQDFAHALKDHWPQVDVLVNNAGIFTPDNVLDAEEGVFEAMVQTNLYSAYYLTRALIDRMPRDGQAYIFNICSIASLQAYPAGSLYTITKHALLGFSRSLRQELKGQIRVSNVMPGATYTDSWAGADLPEDRFMKAEDVAAAIYQAYALSPRTVVEDIVLRPLEGDI